VAKALNYCISLHSLRSVSVTLYFMRPCVASDAMKGSSSQVALAH